MQPTDSFDQIRRYLADAAASWRRGELSHAKKRMMSMIFRIVAATLAIVAIELFFASLFGSGLVLVGSTMAIAFVLSAGAAAYILRHRRTLDWHDLAERVDVAACDHNAVATALDLIESGETTETAARVIADGIRAASMIGSTKPVVTYAVVPFRRDLLLVGGGALAVVLAGLMPLATPGRLTGSRSDPLATVLPSDEAIEGQRSILPTPTTRDAANRLDTAPSRGGAPADHAGSSPAPGNAPPAIGASSTPGQSSINVSASTSSSSSHSERSPAAEIQRAMRPSDNMSERPLGSMSSGTGSADASNSQSVPADAAGADAASSPEQPSEKADQNGSGGAQASRPPSDASKARPGDGDGDGEPGRGKPTDQSSRGGNSDQAGEPTGGNGQSGGQNAPKKSRGVAPLMLGARQPDLLQGRSLPGPDERTKLELPPRRLPETPAADAPAVPMQIDEPAVDVFRVPASMRRIVDQYLQRYHRDADTTAASK